MRSSVICGCPSKSIQKNTTDKVSTGEELLSVKEASLSVDHKGSNIMSGTSSFKSLIESP